MGLLLMCAAIVSVCGGAAVPVTTAKPIFINLNEPQFLITFKAGDNETAPHEWISLYKDGKLTKLLESGTSVALAQPRGRYTYLGSRDGIYRYDDNTGKVERYGTLHDNINKILKESRSEVLYILTEDHTVYKVTDGGTKKVEIFEAKGAHQIELDWDDNLYYYGDDKQPFVVTPDGAKKIQGLPSLLYKERFQKTLTKTPGITLTFYESRDTYTLYPDGTSELYVPTAEQKAFWDSAVRESDAFFDLMRQLSKENNL